MATITDEGIESTSLATYKSNLETTFQNSLGNDLDLDAQTPQGQMIGILSVGFSQIDDSIVQLFQLLNIYNCAGQQIDGYGALFNVSREAATYSTVIATVTGVASTEIPAGSQAETTNGDLFEASANITIESGGTGSGEFQAVESGPIEIEANSLTQIITNVIGWETVNNADAGTEGENEEDDLVYLNRYFGEIYKNANGTVESVRAAVLAVDGVIACNVAENNTSENVTKQSVELLPHSIAVIVNGGDSQDIGDAIYDKKSDGCDTEGADTGLQTAVTVSTNDGNYTITIYYYPVEFVSVTISIVIEQYDAVADTITQIKDAIIAYFDGTFSSDDDGIGIGDILYQSRLYTPINSVNGFDVVSLDQEITGSGTPQTIITPDLNQQLTVTSNTINVTIQ